MRRIGLFLAGFAVCGGAGASTNVGGTIAANTTWRSSGSPFIVTSTLTVASGVTLTISSGVTVAFQPGTSLIVDGKLSASGSKKNGIIFTSNAASPSIGDWGSISFSSGSFTSGSSIAYASVYYAGGASSSAAVVVNGSSPSFSNLNVANSATDGMDVLGGSPSLTAVTLQYAAGSGLVASGSTSVPSVGGASVLTGNALFGANVLNGAGLSISSTSVTNNGSYAIGAEANTSVSGLTGLTVTGNWPSGYNTDYGDAVGYRGGTITTAEEWPVGLQWDVVGSTTVDASGSLNVSAGALVEFNQKLTLTINGTLTAVGTSSNRITLTTPYGQYEPWGGLIFNSGPGPSASKISYADISDAGYYGASSMSIAINGSSPTFDHVGVFNSTGYGFFSNGGTPVFINCNFSGNASGYASAGGTTVDARLSWWGTTPPPIYSAITNEPWLTAQSTSPQYFTSVTVHNKLFNPQIGITTTISFNSSLSGSWTVSFINANTGTTVRTMSGSGSSGSVTWDGTDSTGTLQPNGPYYYVVTSTATGGYSAAPAEGRINLDTTQQLVLSFPSATPSIFSPNGDGVDDTTTFNGYQPFDGATWTVNVLDSNGTTVRTYTGSGTKVNVTWDGNNQAAPPQVEPDGLYTFQVILTDGPAQNTSAPTTVTLDDTPPAATLSSPAPGQTFSNYIPGDVTTASEVGSVSDLHLTNWQLDYGLGTAPTSWTTLATGASAVTNATLANWPDLTVTDGTYTLRLQAWDAAGNHTIYTQAAIIANFTVKQDVLQFDPGTGGAIDYTSNVPATGTETLVLKNQAGQVVRTLVSGSRSPGLYVDAWDGTADGGATLPDGPYFYVATINDGVNPLFTWDLTTQYLNDLEQPGGDAPLPAYDSFNNSPLTFTYTVPVAAQVSVCVTPGDAIWWPCNPPEVPLLWNHYQAAGTYTFRFDGRDNTGAYRPDIGIIDYAIEHYAFSKNAVVVFGRSPTLSAVTVTPSIFSPALGGMTVSYTLGTFQNGPVAVTVAVTTLGTNAPVETLSYPSQAPGSIQVTWDGRASNGMYVAPGDYVMTVTATDAAGDTATSDTLFRVQY